MIADVGLLSSVLANMCDEGAGLGESLATDETDTGLLSCNMNKCNSYLRSGSNSSGNFEYVLL